MSCCCRICLPLCSHLALREASLLYFQHLIGLLCGVIYVAEAVTPVFQTGPSRTCAAAHPVLLVAIYPSNVDAYWFWWSEVKPTNGLALDVKIWMHMFVFILTPRMHKSIKGVHFYSWGLLNFSQASRTGDHGAFPPLTVGSMCTPLL